VAHAIFGSRFAGVREPAWHGLGYTYSDEELAKLGGKVSMFNLFKKAGLSYDFVSAPVGYTLPNGTFVNDEGRIAILREPTPDDPNWASMGIVTADYKFLQNMEIAKGLDVLAKETGWTAETAGALFNGGTIFACLKCGDKSVFGDKILMYIMASDGKATGRNLKLDVSPVRAVCNNTVRLAEEQAVTTINIRHDGNVKDNFDFWLSFVGQLEKAQNVTIEKLTELATVKITDADAKHIIEKAYPHRKKNPRAKMYDSIAVMEGLSELARNDAMVKLEEGKIGHEFWIEVTNKRREGAFQLYEAFNKGEEQGATSGIKMAPKTLKQVANTPYAAYQAVAELANWGGTQNAKVVGTSVLFGERGQVMERAYLAAKDVVTKN
jgi:hypothetical protein